MASEYRNHSAYPNFQSPTFLLNHIKHTFDFYHPRCLDPQGGFYHFFKDNGDVYDSATRHLVSSTRFVINYAKAAIHFDRPDYVAHVEHGLKYLQTHHYQPETGGYGWLLQGETVLDATNHAYGFAFVLLAYATAYKAGVASARTNIDTLWGMLEDKFWDAQFQLYRDEYNADFSQLSSYRGQNANMHMCEALLATFEATHEARYLERAYLVAKQVTCTQADLSSGIIWEHYTADWQIDWDYNRDQPNHLFRPWGFQAGHQTEWSKLLVMLHRYRPEPWLLDKAKQLFLTSMEHAWDHHYGGICYGFAPDYAICDDDKYFWVQAESFAAAALLAIKTGDNLYWHWYEKIWQYSWDTMIDHQYGGWFRILNRENQPYSDEKSPAGKTDYHTMGACYDVLRALAL